MNRDTIKATILSIAINGAILYALFSSVGQRTAQAVVEVEPKPAAQAVVEIKPEPEPVEVKPELKPDPFTDAQVIAVAEVICGEVGPHHEDTGRNVMQVILNRARLKSKHLKTDLHDQIVAEATRRVQGTPQFATKCRDDNRAAWQKVVVREAMRGLDTSRAAWATHNTLWFRTHEGAHLWENSTKGWTRNLSKAGADTYHTFFDGNAEAVELMTKY
jgi:hypothetical protein